MSKSLLRSTSTVSLMTFISRMLGFMRDVLVLQMFGATAAVDAFYIAFKIPNFMRTLFAEGCFSQAFVPILAEYCNTKPLAETKQFISHVSGSLGFFLLLLTLFGVCCAPYLVLLFAPGYHLGTLRHLWASEMLRITFPYIMLISLTALASAVLNNFKMFAAPAFTPALLNIVFILTALFLSPHLAIPIESQAWGVFIAGIVQLSFLLIFLGRKGLLVLPKVSWQDPGVKRVLKLMLPALFGASIGQLSLLVNTIFASFLIVGSVSWLYYSERLVFFPLGVFGVALATVVLPHLSAKHAIQSSHEYAKAMDWGIRCNLIIGVPAMVYLIVLATPLISSLFGYGRVTPYDIVMIQKSVLAYSLGLPAFMLVKVLSTGFYARQDTKTPVKIGAVSILLTMLLNAVLISPLAHAGLALASTLGSWFNVALLLIFLHRQQIYQADNQTVRFLCKLFIANAVLAGTLWFSMGHAALWLNHHALWRFSHLAELFLLGGIIYFGTLWLLGMRRADYRITHD